MILPENSIGMVGAPVTRIDSITGVITTLNNSIMGGPFTKFDPNSKFGYSSKISEIDGTIPTKKYFQRDINNIDNPITLDKIPEDVKIKLELNLFRLINPEGESNNINKNNNYQEYIIGISVLVAIFVGVYLLYGRLKE
jgi:hypothetical protein